MVSETRVTQEASLSHRAAKGSFWLLVFRIFDQGLRLIRTIVLARLLSPSDFGIFGIAVMAISLLDTFSQSGFQQALVHKKGDIRPYLDTSFMVQLFRGTVLALLLFFAAPWVASYFNAPSAEAILKIVSLAILIQGATSSAVVYLSKELDFRKYFLYQISGTVADFAVAVGLAFVLRDAWALAYGFLAGSILRTVVSYLVYRYFPKFTFDMGQIKELFGYGKWVFGSNVVGFFVSQADSFFVAKLSGIASLGFYQVAYKIPSVLNMEVLAGASFPAFAKIQDNQARLKEAYLKITELFAIILFPIGAGIFVVSADFIKLILGAQWLPAVWTMRFLSLAVLAWTFAVVADYLFLAVGKPYLQVKWTSVKLLIMLAFLYPFIMEYGFQGAALAVMAGSLVAVLGFIYEALRITACSLKEFMAQIIFPFTSAFIMGAGVYAIRAYLSTDLSGFVAAVLAGMALYVVLALISDRLFNAGIVRTLKESYSLLKK